METTNQKGKIQRSHGKPFRISNASGLLRCNQRTSFAPILKSIVTSSIQLKAHTVTQHEQLHLTSRTHIHTTSPRRSADADKSPPQQHALPLPASLSLPWRPPSPLRTKCAPHFSRRTVLMRPRWRPHKSRSPTRTNLASPGQPISAHASTPKHGGCRIFGRLDRITW